ncbi:MAG: hypothetical protein ACXVCY_18075 [Pseudobdellovibrionaceae bacterium]
MNPWNKVFIFYFVVTFFSHAYAKEIESAPQEPPYTQEENEFELPEKNKTPTTDEEVLGIEDELKSASENIPEKKPELKKPTEKKEIPVEKNGPAVAGEPEAKNRLKNTPPKVVHRLGKGNVEYIEHPLAAKGLTTITKEGAYIYKTEEFKQENKSGIIRFGSMDPPKIKSADGGTSFEEMYSKNQQSIIMFDYEWHPFSGYGKLGVQGGLGFLIAYGNGRFPANSVNTGKEAKEKYTFVALPLNLGAVYRLEWMHRQWFAPYIAGGGTYIPIFEIRDDSKSPNAVGVPGAYGAGGILFNISAINRDTAFTLKSEYGIANLWVSLDYRYLATFNEELDFSSNIIGAGIAVDY